MIVPNPRTWVTGEVVTAAEMNTEIRDAEKFLLQTPTATIAQSAAQSIPNNAITQCTGFTVILDNDTMTTTSNRISATTTGTYEVGAAVGFAASTAGEREGYARLNGTTGLTVPVVGSGSGNATAQISTVTSLPMYQHMVGGTDYVDLAAFQNSTVALNTFAGGNATVLTAKWVSNA